MRKFFWKYEQVHLFKDIILSKQSSGF